MNKKTVQGKHSIHASHSLHHLRSEQNHEHYHKEPILVAIDKITSFGANSSDDKKVFFENHNFSTKL